MAWHTHVHGAARDGLCKEFLRLANVLVAFEFPENGTAIVTTADEESADRVPSYTIDRLLVVTELGELPYTFQLFFIEEAFHRLNVALKGLIECGIFACVVTILIKQNRRVCDSRFVSHDLVLPADDGQQIPNAHFIVAATSQQAVASWLCVH